MRDAADELTASDDPHGRSAAANPQQADTDRRGPAPSGLRSRPVAPQSDETAAEREQRRSAVLAELADRFDPDSRPWLRRATSEERG